MNKHQLLQLARKLLAGDVPTDEFLQQVLAGATADLGDVQLDLDRRRRCGFPEVVFAEGKSIESLQTVVGRLLDEGLDVLATRATSEQAEAIATTHPEARYNPIARTLRVPRPGEHRPPPPTGSVAVVTAGTSDRPVAEEAVETLSWMNVAVELIQDVGVAGPHRLPRHAAALRQADAVVVVAGMEGALPSVVGGLVDCPVVAVPTSVGYGASFAGLAPLLTMLNSCAANVTVVNIDAGFKAGYVAGLIAQRRGRAS